MSSIPVSSVEDPDGIVVMGREAAEKTYESAFIINLLVKLE